MAYGDTRFCYVRFAICYPLIRPSHAFLFTDHTRVRTLRVHNRRGVFFCGLLRRAILFGEPLLQLNDFLRDDT